MTYKTTGRQIHRRRYNKNRRRYLWQKLRRDKKIKSMSLRAERSNLRLIGVYVVLKDLYNINNEAIICGVSRHPTTIPVGIFAYG